MGEGEEDDMGDSSRGKKKNFGARLGRGKKEEYIRRDNGSERKRLAAAAAASFLFVQQQQQQQQEPGASVHFRFLGIF